MLGVVVGCGSSSAVLDAPAAGADVDASMDPFAGMYDDPSDFPHTNCTPGSMTGFSLAEYWPGAELRTTFSNGQLDAYLAAYLGEDHVPVLMTADDLVVGHSTNYGSRWQKTALDICGVDPDGTLRGSIAFCSDSFGSFPCGARELVASPLHRIAGESEGDHLVRLGEIGSDWPGSTSNVRVDGDIAFLSRFDDGIRIVSIANPAEPVEIGHFSVPGDYANDLKIVHGIDGRRYVVTASPMTNVIDVTDPANPQLVAQLPLFAHSVFIEGTTAYLVTGGSPDVDVWDLSRPRAPKKLASWSPPPSQPRPGMIPISPLGMTCSSPTESRTSRTCTATG